MFEIETPEKATQEVGKRFMKSLLKNHNSTISIKNQTLQILIQSRKAHTRKTNLVTSKLILGGRFSYAIKVNINFLSFRQFLSVIYCSKGI